MAAPAETNSLELLMAFHNAVSRFQDWSGISLRSLALSQLGGRSRGTRRSR